MALFQFRKGRDEQAAPPKPVHTVEAMRRRAIHRLIGAAILVAAGVIGFPMLFDNQPRPISVDLPIVIPDKNKSAALVVPVAPTRPAASAVAAAPAAVPVAVPVAPAPAVISPSVVASVPISTPAVLAATPPVKTAAVAIPPLTTAAPAAPPPPAAKAVDASKAQALLDGKDAAAGGSADDGSRFVVQVGAFADAAKVREVRQKVEGAGLKTFIQVVETKEGSRTRVRVGPFGDKAEANRVADKIRKLDLPVAILAL